MFLILGPDIWLLNDVSYVFRKENIRILAKLKRYVETQPKQRCPKTNQEACRRLAARDRRMDAPTEIKQRADLRDYLAAGGRLT